MKFGGNYENQRFARGQRFNSKADCGVFAYQAKHILTVRKRTEAIAFVLSDRVGKIV